MDNADDYPIHPRKKRSKIVSAIAWSLVVLLAPMSTAWIIGGWVYWFDVLASQQMLIGWIVLGVGALMLIARRRIPGVICIMLAMVSLYPVCTGRHLTLPGVDLEHKPDGVIRVVSWNVHPKNVRWKEDVESLFSTKADIIILIESPWGLLKSIRKEGFLESTPYPFWAYRRQVEGETSRGIVLSRWPMESIESVDGNTLTQHDLFTRVQSPLGSFIVGVMHPESPRTYERWIVGNGIVELQGGTTMQIHQQTREPLLIGADLNAGPAQMRSRMLRKNGLKMTKPILREGGSYPQKNTVPHFVRVQIDDVWTVGNIGPVSWDMISTSGSDHSAVVVDFALSVE